VLYGLCRALDETSQEVYDQNIEKKSMDREALLELRSPYLSSLHSARIWFDLLPDFLRDSNDGVSGTLGGRMRCNPETTPPWEPIVAAQTMGQKWPRRPWARNGRAAEVDWSSGRRWTMAG
jgi:hypothetical protein